MSQRNERKRRADADFESNRERLRGPSGSSDTGSVVNTEYEEDFIPDSPPTIVIEEPSGSQKSIGSIPSQGRVFNSHGTEIRSQNEPLPSIQAMYETKHTFSPSDTRPHGEKISWTISYSSRVIFEGSPARNLPGSQIIHIHDEDNFDNINAQIYKYIRENFAEALASREPLLRYANCTVTGKGGYRTRLPLTSKEDWENLITTKIVRRITDEKLHLNILQEFSVPTKEGTIDFSKVEIVRHELHELMKQNVDGKIYIPDEDREKLISVNTIRDVMSDDTTLRMEPLERAEFIQTILARAQVLFAMWLHADLKASCLQELIKNELTDQSLPLRENHRCHARCKRQYDNLLRDQGGFRAVHFDHRGCHQDLDHRAVIPIHYCPRRIALQDGTADQSGHEPGKSTMYTDEDEGKGKRDAKLGIGGYSEVYCVRIDPYHHQLSEDKDACFALKAFRQVSEQGSEQGSSDFGQELNMLNQLRRYSHGYIVTHLATWTQDGKYWMLLPLAECNLREFMAHKNYCVSKKLWVLQQLCGLASAVKFIHNMYDSSGPDNPDSRQQNLQPPSPAVSGMQKSGWHHDIKLDNILYFVDTDSQCNTLRISDWGAGKVHTYRSRSINTKSLNGTPTYEAPEYQEEGARSRPYDVWSLGCVFLELLVWVASNWHGVKKFVDQRDGGKRDPGQGHTDDAFYKRTESGHFELRYGVICQIQKLKETFSTKEELYPFRSVLDVVEKMLIIKRDQRIWACDVSDTLHNIHRQAEVDNHPINTDFSESGASSPVMPRLSTEVHGRRTPESTLLESPGTSNYVSNMGFLTTTSPVEMTSSPRSYRGQRSRNNSINSELTPSMASRSRNNSNASSSGGIRNRSVSRDPSNPGAPGSSNDGR